MFNRSRVVMNTDLDSRDFAKKLEGAENAVLLDVRTPTEFAQGRIPGARNIDIANPAFLDEISALDKDKTYFVYCRSGNRSGTACGAMQQLGFPTVYNLAEGIIGWTGDIE